MAFNPTDYSYSNDKTGAVGKYYFQWNDQGENIKKITGVKNRKEFRDSPDAQEKYFKWYSDNTLKPSIDRVRKVAGDAYSNVDLANIVHFNGEKGATRLFNEGKAPKPTAIDVPTEPTTTQSIKAQPTPTPQPAIAPPTNADKDNWENMQGAAFQRGIYEDDINNQTPKGLAILNEFGITPDRAMAFKADLSQKVAEQQGKTQAEQQVAQIAQDSTYAGTEDTPRQAFIRYTHFKSQEGNDPEVDYDTHFDEFQAAEAKRKEEQDKQWAGFGDPTQDVNYKVPGTQSGWGSSPGLSSDSTPISVSTEFPTRDPVTGKVTPVVPQE